MKQLSKRKKMLLILPLLALPFIALLFWSLGGGKGQNTATNIPEGLNARVPSANLKNDSTENKLTIYQQAEKDSLRFKEAQRDDPYYKQDTATNADTIRRFDSRLAAQKIGPGTAATFSGRSLNNTTADLRNNEQRINEKLALLSAQVQQTAATPKAPSSNNDSSLELLRAKAQMMGVSPGADPQMEQLSNMLDKIQEIQNPALARQKLAAQSRKNKGQVFAVAGYKTVMPLSSLDAGPVQISGNGFFSYDNPAPVDTQNAISAVVHEAQTVVNGATVKLRLSGDVFINGVLIPKNNFVFGIASLNGDRLTVKISSIRYRNSLFPVDLSAYDMDGGEGIYIPGAITRDVAKESADQSIQNLGFTTYDPSIGAQAASAGITAAKSLFSRKVRLVKVTLKAGYEVLLKDEKQKQAEQ